MTWIDDLYAKRDETRVRANAKLRELHKLELAAAKLKLEISEDEKEFIQIQSAIDATGAGN